MYWYVASAKKLYHEVKYIFTLDVLSASDLFGTFHDMFGVIRNSRNDYNSIKTNDFALWFNTIHTWSNSLWVIPP
jgi:hypothetical protein